jgi:hypothetical protein
MNPIIKSASKFIIEKLGNIDVKVRPVDNYLFATDLCRAGGKLWKNYYQNQTTKEYINSLSMSAGKSADLLIQTIKNGKNEDRGTWIHPKVAIHLAQWISADFAVQVSNIIYKYATNDLTLVQDIVEKTNKDTNTVNNIIIASNPDDLKTVAIMKTMNREDDNAKELYVKLQMRVEALIKEIENKDKIIVEKDCKIDELMRKVDKLLGKNDELNNNIESLSNDVEVLNQNVDKITEKLDIATDDRVVRPSNDKDLQIFAMFSNVQRSEYRTIRRQKRSMNVAKKKLVEEGFNVEILMLEPSPNPINLQIRIKEKLIKVPGIIKLSSNSITINRGIISEQQLINMIRIIDSEKKDV